MGRENTLQTPLFGYKCQECGKGTVLEKIFPEYKTRLGGYPVIVHNARIGICDRCGAEHFNANETVRWRTVLEAQQAKACMQPAEVSELRQHLGLSMEQFAILLGCTRQSLYNWERTNRVSPQSRMADLFMRLVRESHVRGPIDVVGFLQKEAHKIGFELAPSPRAKPATRIATISPRRHRGKASLRSR